MGNASTDYLLHDTPFIPFCEAAEKSLRTAPFRSRLGFRALILKQLPSGAR